MNDTWAKEEFPHQAGTSALRVLEITAPDGRLMLESNFYPEEGIGQIKLYAWPALYRVWLRHKETAWEIWTDSGIPIRVAWDKSSFLCPLLVTCRGLSEHFLHPQNDASTKRI